MSVSRVFSEPTLFASRSGITARSSRPWARAWMWAPRLPNQRSRSSGGVAATSPMVSRPRALSREQVRVPTAPETVDRQRVEKARHLVRTDDGQAVGLAPVARDLRHVFGGGHPDGDGEVGRFENGPAHRLSHRVRLRRKAPRIRSCRRTPRRGSVARPAARRCRGLPSPPSRPRGNVRSEAGAQRRAGSGAARAPSASRCQPRTAVLRSSRWTPPRAVPSLRSAAPYPAARAGRVAPPPRRTRPCRRAG